jgi:hypothetical protein
MRALTMDEVGVVGGGGAVMTPDGLDEISVTGTRPKVPNLTVPDFFKAKNGLGMEQDIAYFWAGTYGILPSQFSTRYWDMTRSDDRADYKHVADIKAGDSHLLYDQTSGDLYVIAPDGSLKLVAQGYSGAAGEAGNNPQMESVKETGPIPLGTYNIGQSRPENDPHGPTTLPLTPVWDSSANRTALLIHADKQATHDASQGCVVLDLTTRQQIDKLTNATLEVVRHVPAAGVYLYAR